jgi:hypothetical protein
MTRFIAKIDGKALKAPMNADPTPMNADEMMPVVQLASSATAREVGHLRLSAVRGSSASIGVFKAVVFQTSFLRN